MIEKLLKFFTKNNKINKTFSTSETDGINTAQNPVVILKIALSIPV